MVEVESMTGIIFSKTAASVNCHVFTCGENEVVSQTQETIYTG